MKLCIRPACAPYRETGGNVRIGGGLHGRATHIPDPTGSVWTLLMALDGSRTRDEVIAAVRHSHPDLTPNDVEIAIQQLHDEGFLYDAAEGAPDDFTPEELVRYRPARELYLWADKRPVTSQWDAQRALRDATVTILGVGGAGGTAAEALTRSGVGTLHLVDPDHVELSNLGRQNPYRTYDIDRPKVEAAADHLTAINPHTTITTTCQRVSSDQDLDHLLTAQRADILLLCADEQGLHAAVNRACLNHRQTWIDTGYHGLEIGSALYQPDNGPCWWCLRLTDTERLQLPVTTIDDLARALPKAPGNPSTPVTAGMSGLWAAHLAVAALTGVFPYRPGTVYSSNLLRLDDDDMTSRTHYPRRADCEACGTSITAPEPGQAAAAAPGSS